MAYKRNPMRSERIASLSRFVMAGIQNTAMTVSTQWFERTLDDSANRRLVIPESFMAVDAILDIAINVCDGLVVYEKMIQQHINNELPFMATENILMEAVKQGGDRQELHELIRVHSQEAAKGVKMEGKPNDLIERILQDDAFNLSKEQLDGLLDAKHFVGRAPQQVTEFIAEHITPILEAHADLIGISVELKV